MGSEPSRPVFEDIARELSDPLRRYLERLVGDRATADDLVQETFLTVGRDLPALTVPDGPDVDGLGYLAGRSLDEINRKAFEGTRTAHIAGGVPCQHLELEELTPETIGAALYLFEHLDDLLFCETSFAHFRLLLLQRTMTEFSNSRWYYFKGWLHWLSCT